MKKTFLILAMLLVVFIPATATSDHLEILASSNVENSPRGGIPVSATIDGNTLSICINGDFAAAHIIVTNANGGCICNTMVLKAQDCTTLLINESGFYTMTVILSDGSSYYAHFEV